VSNEDNELKLLCDDDFEISGLLAAVGAVAEVEPGPVVDQHDSYLDTRSRSLTRAGLVARCRRVGRKRALRVDPVPINAGLMLPSAELTAEVPGRQGPAAVLKQLLEQRLGLKLRGQPTEKLALRNRIRFFTVAKGAMRAELCVIEGTALKPRQRRGVPFGEVELRHLEGPQSAFRELAAVITAQPPLLPAGTCRYRRALELCGLPGFGYGAPAPEFGPTDSIDEVGRAICRAQLQTIRSYEPGTFAGLDTEHLHKMRVATRRLRAALNALSCMLDARTGDFLQRNFKWLAAVLGDVRDLDVHQLDVPRWRAELGDVQGDGWQRLSEELHRRWLVTREKVMLAMTSRRYQRLLERAEEAFAAAPQRRRGHPALEPVGTLGAAAVRKRARQFRRAIKACQRTDDPEAVHQLRIVGKKLRYTGEFFKPLFSAKFTRGIKRLSAFQDELGLFQDSCVAGELAQRLRDEAIARGEGPSYLHVLGLLIGSSLVGAQFGQLKAELALEKLGGVKLLAAIIREAERLDRSVRSETAPKEAGDAAVSAAPRDR
jgi:CHAD domain-containing protein